MINLLGLTVAATVALYALSYAKHVWRHERNPLGALAVAVLALAAFVLPTYILLIRR